MPLGVPMADGSPVGPLDLSDLPSGSTGAWQPPEEGGSTSSAPSATNMTSELSEPQSQGIFVGYKKKTVYGGPEMVDGESIPGLTSVSRIPVFRPLEWFLMQAQKWSREDMLLVRNLLAAAGFVSPDADYTEVLDGWAEMLEVVEAHNASIGPMKWQSFVGNIIKMNGLDPDKIGSDTDFLEAIADAYTDPALVPEGEDPEEPEYTGPVTTTNISKSIYDMTPEAAEAMMLDTMKQYLGRDPKEGEIADFLNAVQTAAKKRPTVTRQVSTFTPGDGEADGGMTETTVTQNEGFGANEAAMMAYKKARNAPDYASFQAVSTYYPALVQMLGATTG